MRDCRNTAQLTLVFNSDSFRVLQISQRSLDELGQVVTKVSVRCA